MDNIEQLAHRTIGAAIEVHRQLGPGLLESAYQRCLYHELTAIGIGVETEKPMPIIYKKITLDHGYRMDLLLENKLVVEIKTVEHLTDVHTAQLLTYLRLGNYNLGLLINFHVSMVKDGIKRVIN
jgi:GxxExxY protein